MLESKAVFSKKLTNLEKIQLGVYLLRGLWKSILPIFEMGVLGGRKDLQRECKFCDNNQMVNMEKPPGSEKWVVTNLDGTAHKHIKFNAQPAQTPQQTIVNMPTNPTPEYEAKITAGLRSEAIAKAHEENMAESEKLRGCLSALDDTINTIGDQLYNISKQLSDFNSIVRAYLETVTKQ